MAMAYKEIVSFCAAKVKQALAAITNFPTRATRGFLKSNFGFPKADTIPKKLLGVFNVPVYNDLANLSNKTVTQVDAEGGNETNGPYTISIDAPSNVTGRAEVPVSVQIVDASGQPVSGAISVSVTDQILCGENIIDYPTFISTTTEIGPAADYTDDLYVQGQLGTKENPQQVNVLGGYVGVDDKMYYTKSFEDGFFSMKLPDFVGPKMIQFLGYQFEQAEVSAHVPKATRINDGTEIKYTDGILEYLKLSRTRKKIFQYFDAQEVPLDIPKIRYDVQERKPDQVYNIKEYESFADMIGFFGEIITNLNFKLGEDSVYTASLYNPKERRSKNTNLKGPPLFIVDGKMTRNANYIAKMSLVPIERVEIYNDAANIRDYYQAIGISGIVKIKTTLEDVEMHPDDAEDVHICYGLQPDVSFPTSSGAELSNRPMVRPQIYWNPRIQTDADGDASFSFMHSDDIGVFVVEVVFQATDGTIGQAKKTYAVRL